MDLWDSPFTLQVRHFSLCHIRGSWFLFPAVDASMAGAGNLEIIVSSNGCNVPNYVQSEGNARFKVNFKPTEGNLNVCFSIVPLSIFFISTFVDLHILEY